MTGATLALPGIDATAAEIARLAAREASPAGGRPCRLEDVAAVRVLLQALADGKSRTAAAKAAGVSEAVLRRWLKPGTAPVAACAELQRAIADVGALPLALPVVAVLSPPVVTVPASPAPVPAPAVRSFPAPSLATVLSWHHRTERSQRIAGTDSVTAGWLRDDVRRELSIYGLSAMPPAPARWLPYGLPHGEIQRRYTAWREATGRGGPTECELELEARGWYVARRLPEITG